MTEFDQLIQELKNQIKDLERIYDENEGELSETLGSYDMLSKLKEKPLAKALSIIGKKTVHQNRARLSGDISVLYSVLILANTVKILEIKITAIDEKLTESGIIEKAKDIEGIKELKEEIDNFRKLLVAQHEKTKLMEESRKRDLSYAR